jgi:hypothetical protein
MCIEDSKEDGMAGSEVLDALPFNIPDPEVDPKQCHPM